MRRRENVGGGRRGPETFDATNAEEEVHAVLVARAELDKVLVELKGVLLARRGKLGVPGADEDFIPQDLPPAQVVLDVRLGTEWAASPVRGAGGEQTFFGTTRNPLKNIFCIFEIGLRRAPRG